MEWTGKPTCHALTTAEITVGVATFPAPDRLPRPESTHSVARDNANPDPPWMAAVTSEDVPTRTSLQ